MNEECVIFSTASDSVPTQTCARLAFCDKKISFSEHKNTPKNRVLLFSNSHPKMCLRAERGFVILMMREIIPVSRCSSTPAKTPQMPDPFSPSASSPTARRDQVSEETVSSADLQQHPAQGGSVLP